MLHEFSTNTTPAFFPKAMGSIHLLNTLRQKVGKAFPVGTYVALIIANLECQSIKNMKRDLILKNFFTC